jgi:hypothetical protein
MALKLVRIYSEAGDFHAIVSTAVDVAYFRGLEGAPIIQDVAVAEQLAVTLPHESEVCIKQLVEVSDAFEALTTPTTTATEIDTLWKKLKRRETILLNKPLGNSKCAAHVLFCGPDGVSVVDSFSTAGYEANVREGFEYLLYRVEGFSDGSDLSVETWKVEDLDPGCNAYIVEVSHPASEYSYQLNIVELS